MPDKAPDCSSRKAIVDSITRACKTNDEKAIAICNFMQLLYCHLAYPGEVAAQLGYFRSLERQLNLAVMLVHHTRKNAATGLAEAELPVMELAGTDADPEQEVGLGNIGLVAPG